MKITEIPKELEAAIDRLKEKPPVGVYPTPEGLNGLHPQTFERLPPDRQHKGINEALLEHMLQTYRLLRLGMG